MKVKTSSIIYIVVFLICIIGAFKILQRFTQKINNLEKYNSFNTGHGCFNGKLSVPLPGKTKCFDCEREMIARDSCNIDAGGRGNPSRSFDASNNAERMFGTSYYGNPSRMYAPDNQLLTRRH